MHVLFRSSVRLSCDVVVTVCSWKRWREAMKPHRHLATSALTVLLIKGPEKLQEFLRDRYKEQLRTQQLAGVDEPNQLM